MTDRERPAERLAVRVADGGPVDWDEAESSVSDERERRVIRHLRLVESVARIHRSAGGSAACDLPSTGNRDGAADRAPASRSWAHLDLLAELGEGAFGEVYRAWDRRLEREVALKLLKVDRSHAKRLASTVVEEGRVLAKLRHPNVVTVYGAEVHEGRVGLWMEFIRGRSLAQVLQDHGPFGAREAALVGIDLCRALAAVHRAGVVHRDVKSQNVMREEGGRILLMDFGAGIETAETVGRERKISGTPLYIAPETLAGEPSSQRSDLYALGVLLYHLVTRSFPLEAGSWQELRERHVRGEAKLLRDQRSDLPEPFVRVVERALAQDPQERFATAGQMEQALSAALGMESDPAAVGAAPAATGLGRSTRLPKRWALAALGLLGAASLVVGLLVGMRRPTDPAPTSGAPGVAVDASATGHAPRDATAGPSDPAIPHGPSYTVEARLYRVAAGSDVAERLQDGAHLALGDSLQLEFQASTSVHVYVINEDEDGHAYALFPMPGFEPRNPLAAGAIHVLPGTRNGEKQSWVVDTPGGREHLMVLASSMRLVEFEADMSALARPGQTVLLLPESTKVRLRGIGGLAAAPATPEGTSASRLFEMAERLAARPEVVQGVWMRRIDLENPRPAQSP